MKEKSLELASPQILNAMLRELIDSFLKSPEFRDRLTSYLNAKVSERVFKIYGYSRVERMDNQIVITIPDQVLINQNI